MQGNDLKLLVPAALNTTYLNVGTLGPTPSPALAAAAASELEWVEAGPGWHHHYVHAKAEVRQFAKRVERTMPDGVVTITQNNSESLLRVLWGVAFEAGDEIITTDHEHGAVVQGLSAIMRRFGVRVRVAEVDSPRGFVEDVRTLLTARTRLVVMSHVSHLTGWELPVADVVDLTQVYPRCRVLVDGAQALGNIVVQPHRLGCDFYVFCGHKWMMAPAGWGGLWVRHDRREELLTRWPTEPFPLNPKALEQGPLTHFSDAGDDLEYGTRCWPRISAWSVTWDYFEEEGFQNHARYQLDLANEARARVSRVKGLTVNRPRLDNMRATALMTVSCQQLGSGLAQWLYQRQILTKAQSAASGIRISWAAFNTLEDLDALMGACADL
jgi:L-cysteine/cystine lyase